MCGEKWSGEEVYEINHYFSTIPTSFFGGAREIHEKPQTNNRSRIFQPSTTELQNVIQECYRRQKCSGYVIARMCYSTAQDIRPLNLPVHWGVNAASRERALIWRVMSCAYEWRAAACSPFRHYNPLVCVIHGIGLCRLTRAQIGRKIYPILMMVILWYIMLWMTAKWAIPISGIETRIYTHHRLFEYPFR
jgi:hypothetical protein